MFLFTILRASVVKLANAYESGSENQSGDWTWCRYVAMTAI